MEPAGPLDRRASSPRRPDDRPKCRNRAELASDRAGGTRS